MLFLAIKSKAFSDWPDLATVMKSLIENDTALRTTPCPRVVTEINYLVGQLAVSNRKVSSAILSALVRTTMHPSTLLELNEPSLIDPCSVDVVMVFELRD